MKRFTAVPFLVALALLAAPASAQELRPFRVSLSAGIGGSADSAADTGFDNSSFQLGFAWERDQISLVGVRYGQLDLGDGELGVELSYVTIAGEYVFSEGYYDSGLYLGLGLYQLDGTTSQSTGAVLDDTAVGVTVGVTAEFPITGRWAALLEISGHYADLPGIRLFGMGHAGLAYRF